MYAKYNYIRMLNYYKYHSAQFPLYIIIIIPVKEQYGVEFSIVSRRSDDRQNRASLPAKPIKCVIVKMIGDIRKYTSKTDGNLNLKI